MNDYQYNEYVGHETLKKEYKLFTFYPKGTSIDQNNESLCEHLLTSGQWVFNEQVLDNINFYLENYIPKYAAAYINSNCEGEMFIGISDDGFVKGIPYKGDLCERIIKNKIDSILGSDLLISSSDINKYIDTELIKVNTNKFKFNKSHNKIVEKYFNQKKKYRIMMDKFHEKKKSWSKIMDNYTTKLHYLLNTEKTRKQFLDYVIEQDPSNDKIINLLKSNEKFNQISGEQVARFKKDKSTVWYWLTRWKDNMTDHVKEFKPPHPPYTQRLFAINIITTLVDMIPHWLEKDDINLYLIKVTFKKPVNNIKIKYKSDIGYLSCFRNIYDDDEPYCQSY